MAFLIRNWKNFLICFFSIVFILGMAWSFLIPKIIEKSLRNSLPKINDKKLIIKNLRKENHLWVFDGPFLENETISAAQSTLDYSIDFLRRTVQVNLCVSHPLLTIEKPNETEIGWHSKKQSFANWIKVQGTVCVDHGHLSLADKGYGFEGTMHFGEQKTEGISYIHSKDESDQSEKLKIAFKQDDKNQLEVSFDAKNLPCIQFEPLFHYFVTSANALKFLKGTLNGQYGLAFDSQKGAIFWGKGSLKNLVFENPSNHLQGIIEEVLFDLEKDEKNYHSFGYMQVQGNSSLQSLQSPLPWDLKNFKAKVRIDQNKEAVLNCSGQYKNQDDSFDLQLEGKGILAVEQADLNLNCTLENSQLKSLANLSYKDLNTLKSIDLEFSNVRHQEITFLQSLLKQNFLSIPDLTIERGFFNFKAKAEIAQNQQPFLKLDQINISDFKGVFKEKTLLIPILRGSALVNLKEEDFFNSTEADLSFKNGSFSLSQNNHEISIENINADINFSQGYFEKTLFEGDVGNAKISLSLDKGNSQHAELDLTGDLKDLITLIPENTLKNKLSCCFDQHHLHLSADMTSHPKGHGIEGSLKLVDIAQVERYIDFGFELLNEKILTREAFLEKWIPSQLSFLKEKIELFPDVKKENPSYVANGWLKAESLPLEDYLAPFLVEESRMRIKGQGSVKGTFDEDNLLLTYTFHKLNLNNDSLSLEVEDVKKNELNPFYQEDPFLFIDLNSGQHFGILSFDNGIYFEKNNGLLFTDINAKIVIDDNNVLIPAIETFSNGVYFSGQIDILFDDPNDGIFDVDVRTHSAHGKLTQLQSLFSHFQKGLFFLKIPMDGDVSLKQDGGHMHFAFSPTTYDFDASFKGSLSDGHILSNNTNVALHELGFNFEYDHKKNKLDFSDIQGTLLVGDPERVEEYIVVGEKIHFTDYAQNRSVFDIWVGDKKRDMLRISGQTIPSNAYPESNTVQFLLDREVSHFGDMHPDSFNLVLKDWWDMIEFDFSAKFNLGNLFQDMQRFSRTGFLFLSRHALKQLNDIKVASGDFNVKIDYDQEKSQLNYHIDGQEVNIDKYQFNKVAVDGKKIASTWILDQLLLDEMSIAADILRKEESWQINFLGFKMGKSFLMGMQGEYFDQLQTAEGKIHLLEADLYQIENWPRLKSYLEKIPLKGYLKAAGRFRYECHEGLASSIDTNLDLSLKNITFKDIPLEDIKDVACHYNSENGLTIHNVQSGLKSQKGTGKAQFNLGEILYSLRRDELLVKDFKFAIAREELPSLVDQFTAQFPGLISNDLKNQLANLKKSGTLEGSLNLDYADPFYAVKLLLKDGEYFLWNKRYKLSQFNLEYDPCELKITSQNVTETPYWIVYKTSCKQQSVGEIYITEKPPAEPKQNPLLIDWQNDPQGGFTINRMRGSFHGATFDLTRDLLKAARPNTQFLEGKVALNVHQAAHLISKDLAEKISTWNIGSGYQMKGNWELYNSNKENDPLSTYFRGRLEGQSFEFRNYLFDRLDADITVSPDEVLITNLHVSDVSGNLSIDQMQFNKNFDHNWILFLSKASAQEFRPNLLRRNDSTPPLTQKPVVVKDLELKNLSGIIGQTESFTADGSLLFSNTPKKNNQNPLFSIPSEILLRIGLDLAVLNPVTGTIYYEIKDARVYLTKLKDVYSQAKMSKFYLSNQKNGSFVDFDGNLSLQVKMKQYNLIFKLAELFTVQVQGSLQKPTYSFQKVK
jgi:hypothetical protein